MMNLQEAEAGMVNTDSKRVLIVGLGKTGLSCARYLSAQGIEVAVTDSREHPPEMAALQAELPDVAVFSGAFEQHVFDSADEIIVSPGVSLKHPLIKRAQDQGKDVLGDVELFARNAVAPVLLITGSNGKSTVTSLVGVMARETGLDVRVGGNIGVPVLELLEQNEPDCYVLELSSFQLEYTSSLNALAATVLNISADHMDRYSDIDEYVEAKKRVFNGDGVMVLNRDDALVMKMADAQRDVVTFGLQEPEPGQYGVRMKNSEAWLCRGEDYLMPRSLLKIPGMHNCANALAALAIGEVAGFSIEAMLRALQGFQGLVHRTQFVESINGVNWFNDSKATNVGATQAALAGMDERIVLIAGGDGKGADFSELKDVVTEKARAVVLIGTDAAKIAEALDKNTEVVFAQDMQDAVNKAAGLAQAGDAVLLSPACASFDMFDNYEHRGQVFMEMVRRLS